MKAKEGKVISIGGGYNAVAERDENVIGARIAAARRNRGWNLGDLTDSLRGYGIELSKAFFFGLGCVLVHSLIWF